MTETLREPFLSWIKDYKPGKDFKICLIKYDPFSFTNVETEAHKSLNLMCKLPYLVALDLRLSHQASLVAWMVKNLLTIPETWVLFLGQEDPWRREWQPTPVFSPGESHGQRSLVGYSPWGHTESDTTEQLILSLSRLESQSFNTGFTHVSMTLCLPSSSTEKEQRETREFDILTGTE